jgi:hypothetical protein
MSAKLQFGEPRRKPRYTEQTSATLNKLPPIGRMPVKILNAGDPKKFPQMPLFKHKKRH